MKKLLSLVSIFILCGGVTGECLVINNTNLAKQENPVTRNLTDKDFTLESGVLNEIKEKLSSAGNLYNYGLNPLSRIYAIKVAKLSYAKITIFSKEKNQDSLSYYVNKNNLTKELIMPILFLYQNHINKVEINLYGSDNINQPWLTKNLTININNIFTLPSSIVNNPTEGNYQDIDNYLFFTSGNSGFKPEAQKQPYMAIDKYGELRWLLPQASYITPLEISQKTILAPINFENLHPENPSKLYPFVESRNLESIDWVGLATKPKSFDISNYDLHHDLYNNGSEELMIANRYHFKQQNLPPNDAIIGYDETKKDPINVYDMDQAWTNLTINHESLWKTFSFQDNYNDWLHLNALAKIDQNTVLVSSRALNTIYAYDLLNKKIVWLITSSDALVADLNSQTDTKIIQVKNPDDLFYGQHGLKYLSSDKLNNTISFITLDNHFPDLTIEKYDTIKQLSDHSFFKKITVNLNNKTYQMDQNFAIDKASYMGESDMVNNENINLDYVYTPDSSNIAFYKFSADSQQITNVFKKSFLPENYRITPFLFDNKDFSF